MDYNSEDLDFAPEPGVPGSDLEFADAAPPSDNAPSVVAEGAKSLARGVVTELPKMAGQAMQWLDPEGGIEIVSEAGRALEDFGEKNLERLPSLKEHPSLEAARQRDAFDATAGVSSGLEMLGPSMGPMLTGAAVGSGIPVVGTLAGAAIGAGVGIAMFFGSEAQSSYDNIHAELLKKGHTPEDAHSIAWDAGVKNGFIEGGTELAAKLIPFNMLKLVPPGMRGQLLKQATKAIRSPAAMIKGAVKVVAAEEITEVGQALAQEYVTSEALGEEFDLETAKQVIVPTLVMSLATAGLAGGAGALRRRNISKALSDPSVDRKERIAAVRDVANAIKSEDPELANMWLRSSMPLLSQDKPIIVTDDNDFKIRSVAATRAAESPPTLTPEKTPEAAPSTAEVVDEEDLSFEPDPFANVTTQLGAGEEIAYENGIDPEGLAAGPEPLDTSVATNAELEREFERKASIRKRNERMSGVQYPTNLDDSRLKREDLRDGLSKMANDLELGQNRQYVRDHNDVITGRLPSQNPTWFKDQGWTVKEVQQAVDKTLAGGKQLGVRQQLIVSSMLDHMSVRAGKENRFQEGAIEDKKAERTRVNADRRAIKSGFAPINGIDEAEMNILYGQNEHEEIEYEKDWDAESRLLLDLYEDAAAIDENAAMALMEKTENDGDIAAGFWSIIRGAKDVQNESRRGAEENQGEQGGRPQAEAPAPVSEAVSTDLLGDDTRKSQELADEQRKKDQSRNGAEDVPATGHGDLLDPNAQKQVDIDDLANEAATKRAAPLTAKSKTSAEKQPIADGPSPNPKTPGQVRDRLAWIGGQRQAAERLVGTRFPQVQNASAEDVENAKKLLDVLNAEDKSLRELLEVMELKGSAAKQPPSTAKRTEGYIRGMISVAKKRGKDSEVEGLTKELNELKAKEAGQGVESESTLYSGYEQPSSKVHSPRGGHDDPVSVRAPETPETGQLGLFDAPAEVSAAQQKDNFAAVYKQVKTDTFRIGIDTVMGPSDAAHIFAPIRKRAQETMYVLVMDDKAKPISLIRHSEGVKDSAHVSPSTIAAAITATEGAHSFWLGHNHPASDPKPSKADLGMTAQIDAAMEGTGIRMAGHVIIATGGKASSFNDEYGHTDIGVTKKVRNKTITVTTRQIRKHPPADRPQINTKTVFEIANKLSSKNSIVLLDTRLNVNGVIALTRKEMSFLRKGGNVNRILKGIDTTNAGAALIVSTDRLAAMNAARMLNGLTDFRVVDALIQKDDGSWSSSVLDRKAVHESQGPFFSRRKKSDLATVFTQLAQSGDFFQMPISQASTMKGIASEIDPGMEVGDSDMSASNSKTNWSVTMPDGAVALVHQKDNELWINAASLESGKSRGTALYHLVANYAFNNDLTFIGDPAGISKEAYRRRTENMVSSALKFGTTRHLKPHPDQAVEWEEGNDEANLSALLEKSYENVTADFPQVQGMVYSFGNRRFEYASSRAAGLRGPVTETDFRDAADNPRGGRTATAGARTLKRAALANTVVRGTGSEARREILAELARQLHTELDPALAELLYSKKNPAPGGVSGSGMSVKAVEKAIAPGLQALNTDIPVHVVASTAELPAAVRTRIQEEGIEPEGVAVDGEIYLIAPNISDTERARTVLFKHEISHLALRKMFGRKMTNFLGQTYHGSQREKVEQFAREQGIDITTRKGRYEAAEEYIVGFAERGEKNSLLEKLYAVIRDWLRRSGLHIKFTDVDLREIVANSGRALKAERTVSAGAILMSRSPGESSGIKASSLESVSNGFAVDAKKSSKTLESNPLGAKGFGLSDIPSKSFNPGAGGVETFLNKEAPDGVAGDVQFLGDLAKTDTFRAKGLRGFNIKTRRMVVSQMLDSIHDFEVRHAIVTAIPVDMMNNLRGKQVTPEMLLHNEAMLKNVLSIYAESDVSILVDVASSLMGKMAGSRAKEVGSVGDGPELLSDGVSAVSAINHRHNATPTDGTELLYILPQTRKETLAAAVDGGAELAPVFSRGVAATGATGTVRDDLTDIQLDAMRDKINPGLRKQTLIERMAGMRENLGVRVRQGVADQYASVRDILDNEHAWKEMRMANASSGAVEATFLHGKLTMDEEGGISVDESTDGLATVLGDLKGEHDHFLTWIAANRAKGIKERAIRNAAMAASLTNQAKSATKAAAKIRNRATSTKAEKKEMLRLMRESKQLKRESQEYNEKAKVTERLFSDEEIIELQALNRGTMADGRNRSEVYQEALEKFNTLQTAVLDIAERSGLINPDERATWDSEFYIPFYRLMEGNSQGPMTLSGMTGQTAFHKLKGADMALNDLLANVVMNWSHLLSASLKNKASVSAMGSAVELGIAQDVTAAAKQHLAVTGKPMENAVFVRVNGEAVWYQISDPLVMQSLESMHYSPLAQPGMREIMRVLSWFKRVFTFGVTQNPSFWLANLMRDTLHSMAVSDISTKTAGVGNVMLGLKGVTDKALRHQLLASGGEMHFGHLYSADPGAARDAFMKRVQSTDILNSGSARKSLWNIIKKAGFAWAEVGSAAENINRSALYQQLREQGASHFEASFQARDLLDFSAQGSWTVVRFLTQVTPFLGARIQGLERGQRGAVKNPGKFAAVTGAVALASMALYLHYYDDDDFKERKDWERDTYWWFKAGGKEFSIPKPFEVGVIGTIAERALEQFIDQEKPGKLFIERLKHALFQTFSMNPSPLSWQAFKPIAEVWGNVNTFTTRPIESMGMEGRSKPERRRSYTSETATVLSRGMYEVAKVAEDLGLTGRANDATLSPVQIEHLIRGYFGWVGGIALGIVDKPLRLGLPLRPDLRLEDMPVVGRFIRDSDDARRYTRYSEEFYGYLTEARELHRDLNYLKKIGDTGRARDLRAESTQKLKRRKRLNRVAKTVSKYNQQIAKIRWNSTFPGVEKARRIDRLIAKKNDLLKSAVERSRQAFQ